MALSVPTQAPVLSTKEKLAGLPSAEQAFGSKQRVDNARGLKEADRHQLKLQFEALAAEHGLRVNDVVDHFGLHRHTYWYFIDTAKPGPALPEPKERRNRTSVLDLPAADQLQLLARVKELINPLGDNLDLNIACVEAGLTVAQYYSLERRSDELREKEARANIDGLGIVPVKGQTEAADDAERLRIHDATTLLAFATRQRLDQAARMLGISGSDIADWKRVLGFTALLPGNSGKSLPLPKVQLQLDTAGKVRLVHGLEHLHKAVKADMVLVAKTIGFHRNSIDAWFRGLEKLEEELRLAAETARVQTEAAAKEKEQKRTAAPAMVELPDADADTLRLYGNLECTNATMHPTRLVGLWRAVKARGGGDSGAMNELLLYYVPVLDQAIRRTSGSEMAHRIDETKLRGYAHPGLWQAIREHRLSETRPFVPFAVAMATTALRDELRGDNMGTSDIARSAQARLRNATQRWFGRNRKAERMPSPQELADIMHVSVWEVCDMLEITQRATISLQSPVGEHGDGELGMLLEDETSPVPDADEGVPAAEPEHLNGVTGELLTPLPADRRRF
ncbi:MAG TPA: sigma-70 domain-containing protein, partial [Candidatus Peribacteria bacterium]|nr:sigma-70 domain-containing protein [Candidatus Peribacteria bacterium]